jgi:hypothetical protein
MKFTIKVAFACATEREALSLERTLIPDNRSLPKDQRFESERSGSSLRFTIESPRPVSAVSSALSLLVDARLFQEVWGLAVTT